MKHQIKYILFLLINFAFVIKGFSQTVAAAVPAKAVGDFNISINTMLACIAIVLLFIIVILANLVNQAIGLYKENNKKSKATSSGNIKPLVILVGLIMASPLVFSQTATATTPVIADSSSQMASIYFYCFIVLIIVEVAIILFLIKSLRFLTGIKSYQKQEVKHEPTLWDKLNSFKPLEEEGGLDTGHNYDGIRELDNITPPWFTATFLATIVFAIIYLYRYEVAHTAPNQFEEFETEMSDAKIMQDSLLKKEGNNIDENSVVMLGEADINAAKSIYATNCVACHGDKGQGGVGPNLTDEYWIHGGSIKDVFKSVKYGWAEKGMKPWKDDFSPKQIAQLSSYIESMKGTNPPNPKEKQGELYVESGVPVAAVDTTAKKQ